MNIYMCYLPYALLPPPYPTDYPARVKVVPLHLAISFTTLYYLIYQREEFYRFLRTHTQIMDPRLALPLHPR